MDLLTRQKRTLRDLIIRRMQEDTTLPVLGASM